MDAKAATVTTSQATVTTRLCESAHREIEVIILFS
jgi:hypothetical protein